MTIYSTEKPSNRFYVYAYLREDTTPYYIGKGSGSRAYKNQRDIPKPRDNSRIQMIETNLTEPQAFELEKALIQKYGRKDLDTGILRNMTDGGDGASGKVWTNSARAAVSAAKTKWHKEHDTTGTNNPNFGNPSKHVPHNKGVSMSEEQKIKLRRPCVHCGKETAPHLFVRYHGNKCKLSLGRDFIG